MDNHPSIKPPMARRKTLRRAMSLLELTIVVAILGLLSVASITKFGHSALGNGGAEGFARKISLAQVQARRSTISTGDNHYLQMTTSGGNVASYALFRRSSGGDVQVDETRSMPQEVTVTSSATTLEFDFEGAALGAYTVDVAGPNRSWQISTVILTGAVRMVETT
ncbi:MAG: prepilin-type N-terminal cleavage/methylation domain-containing protein, partial [Planctomycetes bacterium]|nr:prepilin-type N-terminal cleavage/methylation domain-containing protein [Planctomycetota bacterium]